MSHVCQTLTDQNQAFCATTNYNFKLPIDFDTYKIFPGVGFMHIQKYWHKSINILNCAMFQQFADVCVHCVCERMNEQQIMLLECLIWLDWRFKATINLPHIDWLQLKKLFALLLLLPLFFLCFFINLFTVSVALHFLRARAHVALFFCGTSRSTQWLVKANCPSQSKWT